MPYFVRQPYARAEAPQTTDPGPGERDVLDIAREVLASASMRPPFRIREPLRPGGAGEMVLELTAEDGAGPLRVSLAASDLVGNGRRIPSNAIRVVPSSLTVPAGGSADVTVTVTTPPGASPGLYAGTLSMTGDDTFSTPFEAEVR